MDIPRDKKILIAMSYFTLIVTSAFIAYLFYLSLYPFKIVKLETFDLYQNSVKQGESLPYTLKFEKYADFAPTIRYFLVDGFVYKFSNEGTVRSVGKHNVSRFLTIPKTTPPGKYFFRIELDYRITPWRHITYSWDSKTFEVKEAR